MTLEAVVGGVLNAAREAKAKGSWAYAHIDVDNLTRTLVVTTSHRAFDACFEVRRGRLGGEDGWTLIWKRNTLWVTTGEDFMPEDIRAWLIEHTRAVGVEPRADEVGHVRGGEEGYEDGDEHYWDIYPW